MTNYPTNLDTLTNPISTDSMSVVSHADQHANANDAIEALEAKVGVNSSAVTTSHDYKLSAVTGSAKALTSGTSTQSVTGLTLVSPVLSLTSDATGDMYYRNSGGALTRLPIGTAGQIIEVSGSGIPQWIANPSAADASTTAKGVVEIATTAEINAGTGTGGTGAKLVMTPDAFVASNYAVPLTDIQTFTANGTWTKPTGAKSVLVQAWGGGGAGGAGDSAGTGMGGGGGGGGSYKEWTFNASDLSSTESIVVGSGGTGGSGNGAAGNNSTFGSTKVIAYGGGGGSGNSGNNAGGGGAGISSAGSSTTSTTGGAGGDVAGGAGGTIGANPANPGTASLFGGGGGGGSNNTGGAGALSVYGGGGGGGGASNTGAPSANSTAVGGSSVYGGGGGAGGPSTTGTVSGGASIYGGSGGGSSYGLAGTNGSVRGGGGGGGSDGGNGGSGGRGEVVVTTYF